MLVNGVSQTKIEISDRSISYGDGLFETIRLHNGKIVFENEHLERLQRGCEKLGIDCPIELVQGDIAQLGPQFKGYGVLKIIISRGAAGRGYRPAADQNKAPSILNNNRSKRILTLHGLPDYSRKLSQGGINAFLCKQRLGIQPAFAGIKHLNRLEQVMASREWPSNDFLEGLMLDLDGNVIEGTKSNLFFVKNGDIFTPNLDRCGIEGICRNLLVDAFQQEIKVEECSLTRLLEADEVFFCNSVIGVWPLLSLLADGETYNFKPAKYCLQAKAVFEQALNKYEY